MPARSAADTSGDELDVLTDQGSALIQTDPDLAEQLLGRVAASTHAAPPTAVRAAWGLGRVAHNRGEITAALAHFHRGVELADREGLASLAAMVRMSWSASLQGAGDTAEALVQLDMAEPALTGAQLGQLVMQRGYLFGVGGQPQLAVDSYDRALPLLRQGHDELAEARLAANRGVAHVQLGRFAAARRDFARQLELAERHGQHVVAAGALHNLGWLEGRLGDLPTALRLLDRARETFSSLGMLGRLTAEVDTDQCEVLLLAMLAAEADELAARVVQEAQRGGHAVQVAEAQLMRARSLLLLRRFDDALEVATEAERMFTSTDRPAWAARASYVAEQARVSASLLAPADAGPGAGTDDIARLAAIADALDRYGWIVEAAEVRVHTGRMALLAGLPEIGRDHLRRAERTRRRGVAAVRAEAWHAAALLRLSAGDESGAKRAIIAGLRALDRHRATLGAMELRASASEHGVELGRLGLRLALRRGSPADVLTWAERWRAGALGLSPAVTSSDDSATRRTSLAALRQMYSQATDAALVGAPTDIADQIAAAERLVNQHFRFSAGDPRAITTKTSARSVRSALSERVLVEFVELDGQLTAVVLTERKARLVQLGSSEPVLRAHEHLASALRRVGLTPAAHPASARAAQALRIAGHEVDRLLVAPLALPAEVDVVIVPTGDLHRVVWGALPSLFGRGVTIAPSAAWWLSGATEPPPESTVARVLLVGGPGLEGAADELATIHRMVPGATVLVDEEATAANTLAEVAVADVAHIAAHGTFRSDNPMFSSLRLADGPLWVHDLTELARTPRLVVLTSCEAGRSGVMAGDELLGTATALLSLGVQTVVAPLLAVPDLASARFAVELHRHLGDGLSVERACAQAADRLRASGAPDDLAVACAFQCIGTRASGASRSTLAGGVASSIT